jgi:hypothetical protein
MGEILIYDITNWSSHTLILKLKQLLEGLKETDDLYNRYLEKLLMHIAVCFIIVLFLIHVIF